MIWFKKLFAVVLCLTLLASSATMLVVSAEAEEDLGLIEKVDGFRWFPVPENRRYDDVWEAECVRDGCLCQRFNEDPAETGNYNFLDTVYTENGGLTLTRNGNDKTEGNYWPRIRTLWLETAPEFDIKASGTVYFDIVVEEGTQWNFTISINSMVLSLGKFMAAAGGAAIDPMDTSIVDAPSGTFKGSVDVNEVIEKVSQDPNQLDYTNAIALKNMKKSYVPQAQFYVVGPVGSTVTINELFMSTADDPEGEKCYNVDMGLMSGLGDEYYEMMAEDEEPENSDTTTTVGDTDPTTTTADNQTTTAANKETTTTTTAAEKEGNENAGEKDNDKNALPIGLFAGIGGGVVVIAVIVVVIIVSKKKSEK